MNSWLALEYWLHSITHCTLGLLGMRSCRTGSPSSSVLKHLKNQSKPTLTLQIYHPTPSYSAISLSRITSELNATPGAFPYLYTTLQVMQILVNLRYKLTMILRHIRKIWIETTHERNFFTSTVLHYSCCIPTLIANQRLSWTNLVLHSIQLTFPFNLFQNCYNLLQNC